MLVVPILVGARGGVSCASWGHGLRGRFNTSYALRTAAMVGLPHMRPVERTDLCEGSGEDG